MNKQTRGISTFCIYFLLIVTAAFGSGKQDRQLLKEYFEIAQAYAEVGKYDKAIEYYEKAAVDPAYKNATQYSLARMYGLKNEWKKACSLLEPQYNEAPENIMVLNAYAYALASAGEYEQACTMYHTLYEKNQSDPEAALNYARILVIAQKYDEATAFIEKIKTQFVEHEEKEALDELEEKIKKALDPDQKDQKDEKPQKGQKDQKEQKNQQAQKKQKDKQAQKTQTNQKGQKDRKGQAAPKDQKAQKDKKGQKEQKAVPATQKPPV
ncbi:MAG: tetratricopeptide repeat protein [Treponema sp.]